LEDLKTYFNNISPIRAHTWDQIQPLFTQQTLAKGEYFVVEGKIAQKIGFLQEGIVRAFYRNRDGAEYNKHFFTPNIMLGAFSSLVTRTPNKINQQALTDCKLLTANYADITALYDNHQDIERVSRRLAEIHFAEKEKREVDIVLLDALQRYLIFKKEYPSLEQLIPQYHIASYLGISATQLSRIRRKMTEEGFSLHR